MDHLRGKAEMIVLVELRWIREGRNLVLRIFPTRPAETTNAQSGATEHEAQAALR